MLFANSAICVSGTLRVKERRKFFSMREDFILEKLSYGVQESKQQKKKNCPPFIKKGVKTSPDKRFNMGNEANQVMPSHNYKDSFLGYQSQPVSNKIGNYRLCLSVIDSV